MNGNNAVQAIRVAQVGLLLAALLLGLSWAERGNAVETVGSERFGLHLEAPVVRSRGPWEAGEVLTELDAGVPLDLAPEWVLTATHDFAGVEGQPGLWSGEVRIAKVSGDGRPWWTRVEPLAVQANGTTGVARLNASELVGRATALDLEAGASGRLDITVTVRHATAVTVAGSQVPSSKAGTLLLTPEGRFALVSVSGDGASHVRSVPKAFDPLPLLPAAGAAGLELAAWHLRRRLAPWERVRGLTVVKVKDLFVPNEVPECPLDEALRAAKRTNAVVLVDSEHQGVYVKGEVELLAYLTPEKRVRRPLLPEPIRVFFTRKRGAEKPPVAEDLVKP